MNLTSILTTAAGGWIPMAASAATQLASSFSSILSSSDAPAAGSDAASGAVATPDFPLSSSDRDRLERLLDEDLDSLANFLKSNPAFSFDDRGSIDLKLDASGNAKAIATDSNGAAREIDLSGSEELTSLLARMASCLQRLAPGDSASTSPAAWQIRVDRAGARLAEGL